MCDNLGLEKMSCQYRENMNEVIHEQKVAYTAEASTSLQKEDGYNTVNTGNATTRGCAEEEANKKVTTTDDTSTHKITQDVESDESDNVQRPTKVVDDKLESLQLESAR